MEPGLTVRIVVGERERYRRVPLYQAIVRACKKREGALWVQVSRVAGDAVGAAFASGGRRVRPAYPLVVEICGPVEDVESTWKELSAMLEGASRPALVLQGAYVRTE
ncbi:MAG: DUF190 domain-containing protein [Alicyclobacillus sp.]|nr:DUF190 domain-containing protein [Alicyclobacillus sp.]